MTVNFVLHRLQQSVCNVKVKHKEANISTLNVICLDTQTEIHTHHTYSHDSALQ